MYDLYRYAEQKNILIIRRPIPHTKGIAIPGAICLDENLLFDGEVERTVMAHDLGHCMTGSFYTRNDPDFIRRRMENRADKWAIKKLVPKSKLKLAIQNGYSEVWQLAEFFGITEEMMTKALCWYRNGNLATECLRSSSNWVELYDQL